MTSLRHALLRQVLLRRISPLLAALLLCAAPAQAAEFPFGLEMTLEAAPQPGSKRLPTIEVGERGEVALDLWCRSGRGQFSVAGDTVIFMVGAMKEDDCTQAAAAADDALLRALGEAATWTRRGDIVSFVGPTTVKFRINTN